MRFSPSPHVIHPRGDRTAVCRLDRAARRDRGSESGEHRSRCAVDGRAVDHTGRYRGRAGALVRPGSADGRWPRCCGCCRDAGVYVTVQGGRTSLVAGTVPEHHDVLLSTERLTDHRRGRHRRTPGARWARVPPWPRCSARRVRPGLVFGVDLAARDSATVGGMASTNAGGLRTVRYGNMGEQVLGLDVALPDGTVLRRHSEVRSDNTGYDLTVVVRRRRGHPRRDHRTGSAAASGPGPPGHRGGGVRRSGAR